MRHILFLSIGTFMLRSLRIRRNLEVRLNSTCKRHFFTRTRILRRSQDSSSSRLKFPAALGFVAIGFLFMRRKQSVRVDTDTEEEVYEYKRVHWENLKSLVLLKLIPYNFHLNPIQYHPNKHDFHWKRQHWKW